MVTIPSNYGRPEVERLMLKLFPDYKFSWNKAFSSVKVRVGKFKGSICNTGALRKNVFNHTMVQFFEHTDGSKSISLSASMNPAYSGLFVLITGFIPGIIIFLILTFTVYKKRTKAFNEAIAEALK